MIDNEVLKQCENNLKVKLWTYDLSRSRPDSDKYFEDFNRHDKDFWMKESQQSMVRLFFISEVVNGYIKYLFETQNIPYLFNSAEIVNDGGEMKRQNLFEFIFIKDGIRYVVVYNQNFYDAKGHLFEPELLTKECSAAKVITVDLTLKEDNLRLNGGTIVRQGKFFDSTTLSGFLMKYLGVPSWDFDYLKNKFDKIYKNAVLLLGLDVRENLNNSTILDVKEEIRKDLLDDFNGVKGVVFFRKLNTEEEKSWEVHANKDIYDDFKISVDYLLGVEDFAISFISAEYMYKVFGRNDKMDYSPIILDYVKSIEQLLDKMLKLFNVQSDPKFGLGGKIKSLKDETDRSESEIFSDSSITKLLINFLYDFAENSRNGYIHTDNITDFHLIHKIRSNARILLFMMITTFNGRYRRKFEKMSFEFEKLVNIVKKMVVDVDILYITLNDGREVGVKTPKCITLDANVEEITLYNAETGENYVFTENNCPKEIGDIDLGTHMMYQGIYDPYYKTNIDIYKELKKAIKPFNEKYPPKPFRRVAINHIFTEVSLLDSNHKRVYEKFWYEDTKNSYEEMRSSVLEKANNAMTDLANQYNLEVEDEPCWSQNLSRTIAKRYKAYKDGVQYYIFIYIVCYPIYKPELIEN